MGDKQSHERIVAVGAPIQIGARNSYFLWLVRLKRNKKAFPYKRKGKQSHERNSSCRGRDRTSTEQLAEKQSLVVNPGRPYHW